MKILKRIVIWLLVIVAILVVVAYLLPGSYHVERSIVIKTDKQTVYEMACDFNNWDYWTPWSADTDCTAVMEVIGNCEVGTVQRWDGEEMGKGEMKMTEMDPLKMLKWELIFEGYGQAMFIGMTFEQDGDDMLVTWTADGDLGNNPIFRYYGLMMDSELGADYEKGLQNLKEVCEALPDYPIETTTVESMPALSVKDSVSVENIGTFLETYFPQLYMYIIRKGGTPQGHPYSVTYNWDPEGMLLMEAGIPLTEAIEGQDNMKATETPSGKVLKAVHWGPYDQVAKVYNALEQYMSVLKIEPAGAPWEVYVTDPMQEPDPEKWETIVYFPIK